MNLALVWFKNHIYINMITGLASQKIAGSNILIAAKYFVTEFSHAY